MNLLRRLAEPGDALELRREAERRSIDRASSSNPVEETFMIVTTTPNIEGKRIARYMGVVTGEAIIGANIFSDLFAKVRDIVGGRAGSYESSLADARKIAMQEMEDAAKRLGANAVVGVDLDYEVLGQTNGMLMVTVSGTAVVIEG